MNPIKLHKEGCMANMSCLVVHLDGVCPGPYGKCTCDEINEPIIKETKKECCEMKGLHFVDDCKGLLHCHQACPTWQEEFDKRFKDVWSSKYNAFIKISGGVRLSMHKFIAKVEKNAVERTMGEMSKVLEEHTKKVAQHERQRIVDMCEGMKFDIKHNLQECKEDRASDDCCTLCEVTASEKGFNQALDEVVSKIK